MNTTPRPAARAATTLLLLLLAALAGGCGSDSEPASERPAAAASADGAVAAAEERARGAAAALGQKLTTRLKEALEHPDPVHAIEVCAGEAQELTAQIAERRELGLRRTALRVRNPANAPDGWERAWLEGATAAIEGGAGAVEEHSEVVALEGGGRELRYLKPIYLLPLCTQCHGQDEEIPSRVHDALATHYPDDRATGFLVGDLRGAISVRVPLE